MTSRLSSVKKGWLAAAALLLLALSVPLWPSVLGGATSYVVPRGASMEPAVSSGDLSIVRSRSAYQVGDVAAYRNTALHRVVIHRIVAVQDGAYTFKGDANSFVDPQPVLREQIVGELSVSVPLLGSLLLWLTTPVNALLLMALVGLVVRDRSRLLDAVRRPARAPAAVRAAIDAPAPLPLDDDRVVAISDMSFPHELAIAEVIRPESLLRLADRYDRPVLHDEAAGVLFVVESSMLFRCVVEQPAAAPVPLSVVRDLVAEPATAPLPMPAVDMAPAASMPAVAAREPTAQPRTERERRHNWPRRADYGGRRKPSPHGRDWSYAAGK
jgi:signal peptidase I